MAAAEVGGCACATLEVDVDLLTAAGVAAGVRLRIASAPSAPPTIPPITKSAPAAIAVRRGGRRESLGKGGASGSVGGSGGWHGSGPVTMSPGCAGHPYGRMTGI